MKECLRDHNGAAIHIFYENKSVLYIYECAHEELLFYETKDERKSKTENYTICLFLWERVFMSYEWKRMFDIYISLETLKENTEEKMKLFSSARVYMNKTLIWDDENI